MKASVWEYLALMYDDETWPNTNPDEAIRGMRMNKLAKVRKTMDFKRQISNQHC